MVLIKLKLINETFAIIADLLILFFILVSNTLTTNLLQEKH